MTQTEYEQNIIKKASARSEGTYDIYFEIDCDCQELLDAIGLDYELCEDDDTQNEVAISLTPAEYKESIYGLALGSCNEQTISSYILNPELGEYTTKVTIYTPSGDKICFS
jgi:hypothetical protein